MIQAGPIGAGILCALPASLLLAWRYLALRHAMDEAARRAYRLKAAAFASASFATGALIASLGRALALPAHWALAVAVIAIALLSRSLRR